MSKSENNIIKSIVLSLFDDDGPTPKIYWPETMDESSRLLIAMKTISLLMGDTVYQNGNSTEDVNYFGILPFPDLKLNGLTYFFLILDPTARGNAKAATVTILIDEDDRVFFYENMKYLRVIIDKAASKVQTAKTVDSMKVVMDELKAELFDFTSEIKDPFSFKRQIKILMTGLDRAGKTSFLHAVKKQYSEIIKTLPTKGIARSEEKLFEEQNSIISVWDLGGQKSYREKFLEQRKVYLYNVDLLFYFIDVQDDTRISESIDLFSNVVDSLVELEEFPPIVVCLNKCDPDIKEKDDIRNAIKNIVQRVTKISEQFFVKIFETSIFDGFSLISAYSYGLSQLSPNRKLFENQLKNFAKKITSDAILLLNENGIILSNFSRIDISDKVFEISAPHFQTLYKTFKEFKLLKQDFLISSGITDESKKIIFKRITVEKHNLYLLLFMEKDLNLEKIEKHLPKFSKNLNELIQTYI
ncbi:MAG: ADP-ribosylation factor-like protein [Candidatus Hermodarchaeota archaeon]